MNTDTISKLFAFRKFCKTSYDDYYFSRSRSKFLGIPRKEDTKDYLYKYEITVNGILLRFECDIWFIIIYVFDESEKKCITVIRVGETDINIGRYRHIANSEGITITDTEIHWLPADLIPFVAFFDSTLCHIIDIIMSLPRPVDTGKFTEGAK
jgi:hypothetical protein